ncbi:MAG: 1-(5-phosphoribosyl)-5-[(5-phosphoribosylamino)methylideneamino] imidazole-4-carboxamide isomerase [Synergistetes bacterium]|nr:1-(5-phosphoribosyl)-5-[(5-phosphoribosylamino)methylideneamino] imidazole-4-carboxamide isomerase [Synergistota bacterium]
MLVIPAIDIRGGRCVRLIQGDYGREKLFFSDPREVAFMLRDAGVKRVHVVDLDGAKVGSPVNLGIVRDFSDVLDVQFGGGVRDFCTLKDVLSAVRWAIVGTVAALNEKEFSRWLSLYKDSIILSIDVFEGMVKVSGWQEGVKALELYDFFDRAISMGVKTIIFTDISRDGTLQGVNCSLVEQLVERKKTAKLFVAGGISTVDDLYTLKELGVDGVIVGRAFYEGRITIQEMVSFAYS